MLPSLKLIFSHLKMDGWNTILTFWDGLFSGAFAVSFRECVFVYIYIYIFCDHTMVSTANCPKVTISWWKLFREFLLETILLRCHIWK